MSDSTPTPGPRLTAEELKGLARSQRALLQGLLASVCLYFLGAAGFPGPNAEGVDKLLATGIGVMRLMLAIVMPLCAYLMLGFLRKGRLQQLVFLVPAVVPFLPARFSAVILVATLGYFVALVLLNRSATRVLEAHGIKVGFLGADKSATP